MQVAPIPTNEDSRIKAVHLTKLLDSESEEIFDRITRVTSKLFKVPSAFIAVVDKERVWFKSTFGTDTKESPRDMSICGHAICNEITNDMTSRLFEVPDVNKDKRFSDNPLVTKTCNIHYYLGFVLQSAPDFNIGVYCMVDTKPRTLSTADKKLFMDLGQIVQEELDRRQQISIEQSTNIFEDLSKENNPKEFTNKFLSYSDQLNSTIPAINKSLQKFGINFKEWRIINEIVQANFLSPNTISQKLDMSAPLVSRYLESLELQGLIHRTAAKEGDKRYVQLECTDSGKDVWVKGLNTTYQEASSQLGGVSKNLQD